MTAMAIWKKVKTVSDLISREGAINAVALEIASMFDVTTYDGHEIASHALSALPSKGGDAEMNEVKSPYMKPSPNGADLISRADAIEAVTDIQDGSGQRYYLAVSLVDKIRSLPSAEAPKPSGDLISRADVLEGLKHSTAYLHDDIYTIVNRIPSAEATGALDEAITKYVADGYMLPPSAEADSDDLIIKGAKGIQDGLYNITDGKLFKYRAKGGTVRTYPIVSAEAVQEWILCSERLPSDKTFVLVTTNDEFWITKNSEVKIAECFNGGDYWLDRDNRLVDEVIAWQPLPPPHKGGDDE